MAFFWPVVVAVVLVLLLLVWRMDRSVRRRGARVLSSTDIWYEARESRRDAEVLHSHAQDTSWTSWSRRNRR